MKPLAKPKAPTNTHVDRQDDDDLCGCMQEMGRGRRQREQWEVVGYVSGDETGGGGDAPRLLRFYTRQKRVVVISGLWSIDRTRGFLIELTLKDDKTRG